MEKYEFFDTFRGKFDFEAASLAEARETVEDIKRNKSPKRLKWVDIDNKVSYPRLIYLAKVVKEDGKARELVYIDKRSEGMDEF